MTHTVLEDRRYQRDVVASKRPHNPIICIEPHIQFRMAQLEYVSFLSASMDIDM